MPISIDRHEVQRLIQHEGAQLAEVLPAPEFEAVHLAGAVHLPLKQLTREMAEARLDRSRPVIVYCNNGQ